MIARVWKGHVRPGQTQTYLDHLEERVIPELRKIPGFRGMRVLHRADADSEVVVTTMWESMDAIRAFSGADPRVAVVAPEAQAVMSSYDTHADHYEVVLESD